MQARYDVIVVGAGIAGLSAADTLIRRGRSVLVLEAGSRPGGRIRTTKWRSGDRLVNINVGAHWIAGDSPLNPLRALADAANIHVGSKNGMPSILGAENYDWKPLIEACSAAASTGAATVAQALGSAGFRPFTEADRAALWYAVDYEWGRRPEELPLKDIWPPPYETEYGSDIMTFIGGHDILEPMVSRIGDRLLLGEKVVSIDASDSGIEVSTKGRSWKCDAAILTVSLGVLCSNAIRFTPPLPLEKQHALSLLKKPMAQYEVVVLEYSEAFWKGAVGPDGALLPGPTCAMVFDLSGHCGLPIVEVHFSGEDAERIASLSLEGLSREVHALLVKHIGASGPPLNAHCERWGRDPLFMGAFSTPFLGIDEKDAGAIAAPCADGRLLFAGDGMHPVHKGYMHGAYLSGIDAARRLL